MPRTDALFAHVQEARGESAADPDTPRISVDTRAKVKVGDFPRGGEARAAAAVKAVDHDMAPAAILVPFGVPELARGAVPLHQPWFLFGHSKEASDFLADGLDLWRDERKSVHPGVKRLHIELDNGPEVAGNRTQFLHRIVGFADRHRVAVALAYLPPHHSKDNPTERCWGGCWSGTGTGRCCRPWRTCGGGRAR